MVERYEGFHFKRLIEGDWESVEKSVKKNRSSGKVSLGYRLPLPVDQNLGWIEKKRGCILNLLTEKNCLIAIYIARERCPDSEFDDTLAVSFQISSANLVKSGSES